MRPSPVSLLPKEPSTALAQQDASVFQEHALNTVARWPERLAPLHAGRLAAKHMAHELFEPARTAFLSSGKRLRPLLASWTWRTATDSWQEADALPAVVQVIGTAAEMLHAASLVIDDIQDGSLERRGQPSLHATCGVAVAINVANWLYFEALDNLCMPASVLAPLGIDSKELMRRSLTMMSRCHMGQALDMAASRSDTMATLVDASSQEADEFYDLTIRLKTAELMGFAIDSVADSLSETASQAGVEAARRVSQVVGRVYQQADDLRNMSVLLSTSKTDEDFNSLRNRVAIRMLRRMDRASRTQLLSQKDAGLLAGWLRQHPTFRPALGETYEEVAGGLAVMERAAQACGAPCHNYLRATILAPIEKILAQVQQETGVAGTL